MNIHISRFGFVSAFIRVIKIMHVDHWSVVCATRVYRCCLFPIPVV